MLQYSSADRPKGDDQRLTREDEERLVAAAQGGDRDAWTVLIKSTQGRVYTLARRLMGNDDDARDVVQNAYVKALKGIQGFKGQSSFSTWMYRVTVNAAKTALTSKPRHSLVEDAGQEIAAPETTKHDDPGQEELVAALADLTPNTRVVVVLKCIYGLTHPEIMELLGVSESVSKLRLMRGMRHLRDKVSLASEKSVVVPENQDHQLRDFLKGLLGQLGHVDNLLHSEHFHLNRAIKMLGRPLRLRATGVLLNATDEQVQEILKGQQLNIVKLHRQGFSSSEIVEALGLSRNERVIKALNDARKKLRHNVSRANKGG